MLGGGDYTASRLACTSFPGRSSSRISRIRGRNIAVGGSK